MSAASRDGRTLGPSGPARRAKSGERRKDLCGDYGLSAQVRSRVSSQHVWLVSDGCTESSHPRRDFSTFGPYSRLLMTATILIIEDDPDLANLVAARLQSEGYVTEVAPDGAIGVTRSLALRPDLVILDLMLPGLDGLEVCRQIRAVQETAIIMLTAKDSENDMLVGLGVGADDYIAKPFSPRVLTARVQAVLRRVRATPIERDRYIHGDLVIDEATRTVRRQGEAVHLTPTEFDLLWALLLADGAVLAREQLLQQVWGYRIISGARTVDSHIRSVRHKLGNGVIRTVHGVGYALELG